MHGGTYERDGEIERWKVCVWEGGWRKGEGKETDGDRKERVRQVYVMYVKIKNIYC